MNVKGLVGRTCTVAALVLCASFAQAATYSARLVSGPIDGTVELNGFGRVISALGTGSSSFSAQAGAREPFFDTWNIDVSAVSPGLYRFDAFTIDATGSLEFASVTFNSIDESGARHTVLFDLNALRTQAVGSGTFTVRSSCPIDSCVWIDIAGSQLKGVAGEGYGGSMTAALVPEPSAWALMLLGGAALGAWVRRRPAATA